MTTTTSPQNMEAMDVDTDTSEQAKKAFLEKYSFGNRFNFNLNARSNASPLLSCDYKFELTSGGQPIPICVPIFHKCITALQDYQHKSLEELRWEDYLLGRKTASRSSQLIPTQTPSQIQTSSRPTINPSLFNNNSSNSPNSLPFPDIRNFGGFRASQANALSNSPTYVIANPNSMGTFLKFAPMLGAENHLSKTGRNSTIHDTRLISISAMLEYQNKSYEELRWEDYQCKRIFRTSSSSANSSSLSKENANAIETNQNKPPGAYDDKGSDETETSCPICLESIQELKKNSKRLMVTLCGHILCKDCTANLINLNPNIECPTCRKKLSDKDIHILFL